MEGETIPAITELRLISGDTQDISAPEGFTKLDVNLNAEAEGKYIYLCYRTELVPKASLYPRAIAGLCIINGQGQGPAGFEKVPTYLNGGIDSEGKRIYSDDPSGNIPDPKQVWYSNDPAVTVEQMSA